MAYLTGECLCGKIRYEYCGATGNLVHCHCSKPITHHNMKKCLKTELLSTASTSNGQLINDK
ncbi:MAG: hypothetical protein ACFCAD_28205 [Pleurocapsa sp.]